MHRLLAERLLMLTIPTNGTKLLLLSYVHKHIFPSKNYFYTLQTTNLNVSISYV